VVLAIAERFTRDGLTRPFLITKSPSEDFSPVTTEPPTGDCDSAVAIFVAADEVRSRRIDGTREGACCRPGHCLRQFLAVAPRC
jgi:hypothetical protein